MCDHIRWGISSARYTKPSFTDMNKEDLVSTISTTYNPWIATGGLGKSWSLEDPVGGGRRDATTRPQIPV